MFALQYFSFFNMQYPLYHIDHKNHLQPPKSNQEVTKESFMKQKHVICFQGAWWTEVMHKIIKIIRITLLYVASWKTLVRINSVYLYWSNKIFISNNNHLKLFYFLKDLFNTYKTNLTLWHWYIINLNYICRLTMTCIINRILI